MIIELITMWYNEEFMAPFFLSHYSWVDKIHIILDSDTNDNTEFIARQYPNVVIEYFQFTDMMDDVIKANEFNKKYRTITNADYVILVDSDEFIFCNPLEKSVRSHIEETQKDIYFANLWQIYKHKDDAPLDPKLPVPLQRRHGDPDMDDPTNILYVKPAIVKAGKDICWGLGNHELLYEKSLIKWHNRDVENMKAKNISVDENEILYGAHWKLVDLDATIKRRIIDRKQRQSKFNLTAGLTFQYHHVTEDMIIKEYKDNLDRPIVIMVSPYFSKLYGVTESAVSPGSVTPTLQAESCSPVTANILPTSQKGSLVSSRLDKALQETPSGDLSQQYDNNTRFISSNILERLKAQVRQSVILQKEGKLDAALGEYELVFEVLRFYEEIGYVQEVGEIQRLVLESQSSPEMTLYFHGLMLYHRRHYSSAADAIDAALLLVPGLLLLQVMRAKVRISLGDLSGALAACENIQQLFPQSNAAREVLFVLAVEQEMPGEDYYSWLQRFHEQLRPASYVEIGLGHGRSLALAGPETKAVGIDPYQGFWDRLNYVCPHGPATLFPLTSDDFFAQHDLREVIGKDTFDLAFIDGLHLFEQALKDFINLERYAGEKSVILIHDCLPIAPVVAERERCTGFWTGDVWRIIPCLKAFRPDLTIKTIPAKPSGLAVVTNLNPASQTLADNFDDIVAYYRSLHLPESFAERRIICNVGTINDINSFVTN
ncbi:MAG: glycosyltransferase family 2 protein [Oryzomonas sp.]|uniref:class I SAM-dependent methyltransferase n=1 Tax=Oryzomonas sp. TaxID=2855186 RepID=UPI00284A5B23|nr:class I SAM-dependent methyltransferase [Oryzomonas sp.]MDR3579541.1 glycosyltransferase family 2 protein [Oryzomonas sp.]